MRDEVGVLIGLSDVPGIQISLSTSKGWATFLTRVLHSSSYRPVRPNSISLQQIPMGPTGFPAS
jgi:hypothetical protein